jgi:hypothetical protein
MPQVPTEQADRQDPSASIKVVAELGRTPSANAASSYVSRDALRLVGVSSTFGRAQNRIAALEQQVTTTKTALEAADTRSAEAEAKARRATEIVSRSEADPAKAHIVTLEKEAAAKAALAEADARATQAQTDATQAQKRIAIFANEAASAAAARAESDRPAAGIQTGMEQAKASRSLSQEQQHGLRRC